MLLLIDLEVPYNEITICREDAIEAHLNIILKIFTL